MDAVSDHHIDGKQTAAQLRANIASEVSELKDVTGEVPGLAVILVGDDPASRVYVANKHRQTVEAGMKSLEFRLSEQTTQVKLVALIERLNEDHSVHGILVQLPLPAQIEAEAVINAIAVEKDVDGFHVLNAGRLATGQAW